MRSRHPRASAIRHPAWRAAFAALACAALCTGALPAGATPEGAADAGHTRDPLAALRGSAERFVRAQLGPAGRHAIITPAALDPRLRLAPCPVDPLATLPAGVVLRSEVTVTVSCRQAGWTMFVPVRIEMELAVLVLQRPVAAGAHFGAEDVAPATRRVAGVFSEYLPDAGALARQHARRPLPAGTVLLADMLAPDPMVVRGQAVTLVASLGTLEVRAPGRVMSDAAAATRVRVQNLSSQRVVEGTVESADVVRVGP